MNISVAYGQCWKAMNISSVSRIQLHQYTVSEGCARFYCFEGLLSIENRASLRYSSSFLKKQQYVFYGFEKYRGGLWMEAYCYEQF